MLSIRPYSLRQLTTRYSFKSHINENDDFRAAIKETKNDFSMAGFLNKGLATMKALRGLSEDNKSNFLEFVVKEGNVYTKINGAIADEYTFNSSGKKGVDIQNAIINYAKDNNSYSQRPLSPKEEKVKEIQFQLGQAKAQLFREMHNLLKMYK